MPLKKNKKIYIYIFLFLIIGTFHNKNLDNINLVPVNEIIVTGLDKKNNMELNDKLNFLKIDNLFFLKRNQIEEKINLNNQVEKYFVQKIYPKTIKITISRTKILARLKKNGDNFLLGSNGKFIKEKDNKYDVPFIFGDFENKNFFELKDTIEKTNFDYDKIQNLFFFKSGRWDIETKNGLLIKLPKDRLKESLKLLVRILEEEKEKKIHKIDLRQNKQVIING